MPNHYAYRLASYYDYPAFYKKEINLRQVTSYPPFTKIIRVLFTSEDENLAKDTAKVYYNNVRELQTKYNNDFVYLGVMKSPIGRIQNKYRIQILMRIKPQNEDEIISQIFALADSTKKSNVSVFVELNPQNLS